MGDNKGLIAIALSVLFFIVWYTYISPKIWPEQHAEKTVAESTTAPEEKAVESEAKSPEETAEKGAVLKTDDRDIEEIFTTIETDSYLARFSSYGAAPVEWKLKKYTVSKDKENENIDMVSVSKKIYTPLILNLENSNIGLPEIAKYSVKNSSDREITYFWNDGTIEIEKKYSLAENNYEMNLDIIVRNVGMGPIRGDATIGWSASIKEEKNSGFLSFLKRPSDIKVPVYFLNGKTERETATSKIKTEELPGRVFWSGIEDRYFLSSIIPKSEGGELAVKIKRIKDFNKEEEGFYTGIVLPGVDLVSGGEQKYSLSVFAGPKEMNILKAIGYNMEKSIDYGWFTFIAIPILYALKFLYSVFHNYGIAIILLTIVIKILLHPISKKSMKSMKKMQQLQPKLKELKEKYKDNKERLNQEMMQLFKSHKVNPMSGCLPMVLQFPVYIALYRVLWNSIELYQAPLFWFYNDLSQPDPYFIMPVLLGIAMFLQQKLTPSATADPTQKKMMMMMPLMFTVFLAFLPVGLVLYILVNTVLTVIQQWMNNNDIRLRDVLRGRFAKGADAL